MGKCILAVTDILEASKKGLRTIPARTSDCIVTPAARDKAAELGITIEDGSGPAAAAAVDGAPPENDELVRQVCALTKERLPAGVVPQDLERLVRAAVAARLEGAGSAAPTGAPQALSGGVRFVSGVRLLQDGTVPVPVAEKAWVAEAIRCGDEVKLAGGYMEWQQASFDRTVEHPEIGIVIEGELRLAVGGKNLVARAGDMVYFPQGVQVAYSSPGRVRIACVNCIR